MYAGSEGQVCGTCHIDTESDGMLIRQTREKVVATAMVPGYVAVGLMLVLAMITPFMENPGTVAVAIAFLAGFSGIEALWTAATQPETPTGLRWRLAGAALFQLLLLWVLPLGWFFGT